MANLFIESLFKEKRCTSLPTLHDMRALWQHALDNKGWVYIAENPVYEGLLKIGYTQKDPFTRAKSLKTAGVVGKFSIIAAFQMVDCIRAETLVHDKLKLVQEDGEFFRINKSDASAVVQNTWREERDAFNLFKVEWLLHDKDQTRWMNSGFDLDRWHQKVKTSSGPSY